MGIGNWLKGGLQEINDSNVDRFLAENMGEVIEGRKDYDYSEYTPQAQLQASFGGFAIPEAGVSWLHGSSFEEKKRLLVEKCPISAACIEMRSCGVGSVPLKVEGSQVTQDLLVSPNTVDKTMGNALRSWEEQLTLGGDLYLFFDLRVPGRPQVSSLRQDCVVNNISARRYEYTPGALTGKVNKPDLIFDYDPSGQTTRASMRTDTGYQTINGKLVRIFYYNPTDPNKGQAPADAAIQSAQLWLHVDDLIQRKLRNGGAKAGYLKLNRTDADKAKIVAEVAQLNSSKTLNVLPPGMDYVAAQLTMAELQLEEVCKTAASAICSAFKINSAMVNVGTATHANLRGMNTIFYNSFVAAEAKWLVEQFEWGVRKYIDPNASITVDETGIQHVQDDIRESVIAFAPLGILTIDEVRELIGKPPLPNGEGKELCGAKAAADATTGLGQPEEKPGGETSFNANAGSRGDNNEPR